MNKTQKHRIMVININTRYHALTSLLLVYTMYST